MSHTHESLEAREQSRWSEAVQFHLSETEIAARNVKAGNHTLGLGETLTVPTFRTNGTLVEGNLAQCAQVLANDTSFVNPNEYIVPGEYALSAVDGANATYWRPISSAPATLSIDLSSSKTISGLHFNWGLSPPLNYSVLAGDSLSNMTAIVSSALVEISSPYDAQTANAVSIRVGNLTDVTLNSTVVARYVNLTIEGSRDGSKSGGTVAEFAVL